MAPKGGKKQKEDRHRASTAWYALTVYSVAGVLVALFILSHAVLPRLRQAGTHDWVEEPCTILSSGTERSGGKKATLRFTVRYRYRCEDTDYTAEAYSYWDAPADPGDLLARLPLDRQTVGYVNPLEPGQAIPAREAAACLCVSTKPLRRID
jgi:hypothetical protein